MNPGKLRKEIRVFQNWKPFMGTLLVVIGLLGLVLPIIPGIVLISFGLVFLLPKSVRETLKQKFRFKRV